MSWYIAIPFAFILLAFIFRFPIGWGMLTGSVVYFIAKGLDFGTIVNATCYNLYSSYILIAIPLFIFTANVMNSSSTTEKIFDFANALVGRFKGGTAYVNIVASLIFAGMTGSALADASGLGLIEIKQMKKEGYDLPFACAITAATSVIGPIFPPSIPFVIYAMLSNASVGKLFLGGMIPAFMLCIALGVYVWYISNKRNYPVGVRVSGKQFLKDTFKALPALFTPVILLIGIYTGIMTPTEAGAVAALYTLVIALIFYKTLTWKKMIAIVLETIRSTGSIFLVIAAAFSFSYIINLEQVAPWLAGVMSDFGGNKWTFLVVVNIIFLILGALVDVTISQYVFVPLFLPLAKILGIDMVHFGVMLVLNMMIGLLTPP